jgi:hypothetical protein
MFARLSRSWNLLEASASVLSKDKELLLFPLISTGALLLVVLSFAFPVLGLSAVNGMDSESESLPVLFYVVAFLFYFCQYFVIFFFNTALVGAAMIRLDGGNPTFRDGMRIAKSKIGVIAGYALVAATVGMILRAIEERVGFIGKIVVGLIGVGWTIATYLVVPVLAARDVGPIQAVKESATLLKKTWGENVIGQAGLGLAFFFIFMAVAIFDMMLVGVASFTHNWVVIGIAIVLAVMCLAVTFLVQSALSGIYAAALYRYATTGKGSVGFDANVMQAAFAAKK